jgi:ABC-type transporter Mla subunit MlaD
MPGERSQNREALMGGIALASLILAFLFIFFLADLKRMFTRTDDLYVLMPSAAALKSGSLVWIAGRTVGQVKAITVRPPGTSSLQRVLIRIEVERRYREHIRRDSEVRVTSFRVIGDPVLDITPGSRAAPAIQPNDTLRFRSEGTPNAAMARARSLHASFQQLLAESKSLTTRARDRSARSQHLSQQLAASARELRTFSLAVQQGPLNTLSDPEFQQVMNGVASTIGELRHSFARAAERARTAQSEAEPGLRRLSARADTIAQAIEQLQQAIAQGGGGLLTRAVTDSAIFKALHGAQAQLDSLVVETQRSPWRFWF